MGCEDENNKRKRETGKIMKKLLTFGIVFLCLVSAAFAAKTFPFIVRPMSGGATQPSTSFTYVLNFTSDSSCATVLHSTTTTVATDAYGIGSDEIDITKLNITPSYLCEYRDGLLRKVHNISAALSSDVLVEGNLTVEDKVNISSDFAVNKTALFVDASTRDTYHDGDVFPFVTLSYDLGSGPLRWRNLYVANISADYIDATENITTMADVVATNYYGSIGRDLGLNEYGECIAQNGTWVGEDETSGYCEYKEPNIVEKMLAEEGISTTSATMLVCLMTIFSVLIIMTRARKKRRKEEEEEEEWES